MIALVFAVLFGIFIGILIARVYLIPAPVMHFDCPDTSDFFTRSDFINLSVDRYYNTTTTGAIQVENINTIKE